MFSVFSILIYCNKSLPNTGCNYEYAKKILKLFVTHSIQSTTNTTTFKTIFLLHDESEENTVANEITDIL